MAAKKTDDTEIETPNFITQEDFDEKVNKVITNHNKRLMAQLEKKFAELLVNGKPEGGQEAVDQALGQDDEAPAKKAKPGDAVAQELAALRRQVESERKARLDAEKKQEEEAGKRRRDEERSRLASTLRANGVTNEAHIKAATSLLYTEEQRVGRTEDGRMVFKSQKDGFMDEVDLDEGVKTWLKEDEGKAFLPPKGSVAPSVQRREPQVKGEKSGSGKPSMDDLARNLQELTFKRMTEG
jgi:hypothetical protein